MGRVTVDPRAEEILAARLARAYRDGPAQVVRQRIQAEAPVDTGLMRAEHSVDPAPVLRADGWHIIIRAPSRSPKGFPYPIAVHNGRREVVPVQAKALRFVINGAVIFAKRVRAVPPNPWMFRAFTRIGFRQVTRPNTTRPRGT